MDPCHAGAGRPTENIRIVPPLPVPPVPPASPVEANGPVLLEEARRALTVESDRVRGLQTSASALIAAIVVLIGLTVTVETQFSGRDIPRGVPIALGVFALAAQIACGLALTGALAPKPVARRTPQTIEFLTERSMIEATPERLTEQLMGNLGREIDLAREDARSTREHLDQAARRLRVGVAGLIALVILFAASSASSTSENVKVLGVVATRSSAPVSVRVTTPVRATVSGRVQARITAPVTIVKERRDGNFEDWRWHAAH